MIRSHKVACVLPAYNAARTLERTLENLPVGTVDYFILVDDASSDDTLIVANQLKAKWPIQVIRHDSNRGYGANQKTCYRAALSTDAEVIVMLHPDFQYEPRLLPALAEMVISGVYQVVIASRMISHGPLEGGMPLYKVMANACLTRLQNLMLGLSLTDYHSGYRAYHRSVLERLPLESFSDDFIFDNQILVAARQQRFRFGEISVPAHYFVEASSISFKRSFVYGLGVLRNSFFQR